MPRASRAVTTSAPQTSAAPTTGRRAQTATGATVPDANTQPSESHGYAYNVPGIGVVFVLFDMQGGAIKGSYISVLQNGRPVVVPATDSW